MGKREVKEGRTDVDQYRKRIGKQEFKGRSKRNTLASRERAQKRKSSGSLQIIFLYLGVISILLLAIYMFFYYNMAKPADK